MKVKINLIGCDGTTAWEWDITEEERLFLERIKKESKKQSPYSCYPILDIYCPCPKCEKTHHPDYCYIEDDEE